MTQSQGFLARDFMSQSWAAHGHAAGCSAGQRWYRRLTFPGTERPASLGNADGVLTRRRQPRESRASHDPKNLGFGWSEPVFGLKHGLKLRLGTKRASLGLQAGPGVCAGQRQRRVRRGRAPRAFRVREPASGVPGGRPPGNYPPRAGEGGRCPPKHDEPSRGQGIRTPEGFPPTRFPSVRHRPLGESSAR